MGAAMGLALASSAGAETIEIPPDMVACQLEGISLDADPAGLNVRVAPSLTAKVIARLPERPNIENGSHPEFKILGFKDGWFLIDDASYGDYGDPLPPRPLYAGKGWVHGSKLGGGLVSGAMSSALAAEPRDEAPRATAKPKDGDYIQVRALLACKGEWVKVNSNIGIGWAFGLCSNQVTTCN
jgi:hypothetical protein